MDELARGGVTAAVVAPGSRSTPLALALDAHPGVRAFSVLDERGAAFFALGLAKRAGAPVAVVCTSGTAAANLLPAVVEANLTGVPLVLLTADRPHALRDVGANQTIDQNRLFGSHARAFVELPPPTPDEPALRHLRATMSRVVATATARAPGPVHVNVPFAKPLEPTPVPGDVPEDLAGPGVAGRPDGRPWSVQQRADAVPRDADAAAITRLVSGARRGLIVCGPRHADDGFAAAARALGRATGFPVLADPLSGVRFGAGAAGGVVGAYDALLAAGFGDGRAPDLVLRFGAFPVSAALERYLDAHAGVPHVVVDEGHAWRDPLHAATHHVDADAPAFARAIAAALDAPPADPAWTDAWRRADAMAWKTLAAAHADGFFEGTAAAEVVRHVPDGGTLLVSSSMPVRDVDRFAEPADRAITVLGSRGASGIDGIASTALGVAAAVPDAPTVLLTGDVAFVHDLNGLLTMTRESIDLTVVVVNNDGGHIFDLLPVAAHADTADRLFRTPHGLDLAQAARLFHAEHARVTDAAGLAHELAARVGRGRHVIEVASDPDADRTRRNAVTDTLRDALAALEVPQW